MDWLKKRKKEKQRLAQMRQRGAMLLEDIIECCDGKSNSIKFFSADQIIKATNNFSYSNRVHGFGSLDYTGYSGQIDNHPMRFLRCDLRGYERRDYCRNIAISSMVSSHKNFMKLLGCCLELENPVLVYNDRKISMLDLERVVSWKRRIKIAEDTATALAYLHTAFPRPFVYRGLCLGNIFLDEDGVAGLSDFSYCISIPQGETFVQVDQIVGAYEYGSFEDNYLRTGIVSENTDIFASGIIMQKLLTGQERFPELCEEEHQKETKKDDDSDDDGETMSEMSFPRRSGPAWLPNSTEDRRIDEIADPKMLEKMDEVGEVELFQMKAFLTLSLRCIGLKGEVPNMVEVAKELKKIQRSTKIASSSHSGEERFRALCEEHWEKETRNEDGDIKIMSEMSVLRRIVPGLLSKSVEELAHPEMDEVEEVVLCKMKASLMLSLRCTGIDEEIPNMVEVAKELKKTQRSMKNGSSSSTPPTGEQIWGPFSSELRDISGFGTSTIMIS